MQARTCCRLATLATRQGPALASCCVSMPRRRRTYCRAPCVRTPLFMLCCCSVHRRLSICQIPPNTNSTLPFTSCAVYQWFCRRKLAWFCQAYIFQSGYHYLTYFRSSLRSRSFSMVEPVFQKKCNGHPRSRTLRRGNGKSSSTTCYEGKSSVESMSSLFSQMRFNYFARTAITGDSALMCV